MNDPPHVAPEVGVLALQGAFAPHLAAFARLGVQAREVRRGEDLEGLSHLVLPGGESTTIRHLLDLFGLTEELVARTRAGQLALFGVCAGAILLGADADDRPRRLGLLDAHLERNGFGRQAESFTEELHVDGAPMRGVFIRAPRIASVGADVRVLARRGDEPVLVESGGCLAATFHPELSGSDRLHARFLAAPRAALPAG
ncbi:MAG: pyridoxal 5'-phosphate synthase glutaminase subunit PdxT [Planctomycetota bacterium]